MAIVDHDNNVEFRSVGFGVTRAIQTYHLDPTDIMQQRVAKTLSRRRRRISMGAYIKADKHMGVF